MQWKTWTVNHGSFPESSKSILVVAPHNVEQAKFEFAGLNFPVETGSRYLGSFTGEATERDNRIANIVDDWVYSIKKLAGAARDYPQSAYSALQRSVQYNKNGSIYNAQLQTLNHAVIY